MDRELLQRYSKGIIASTGCLSGEIQTRLTLGPVRRGAARRRRVPGHLRQGQLLPRADGPRHRHRAGASATTCCSSRKTLGLPTIATNDSHYNNPEDADAQDALICVASGKRLADPNRLKFDGGGYYIKSAAEMRELWADVRPGGVRQHPRDRRAVRRRVRRVHRRLHGPRRRPGRRDRGELVPQGGVARHRGPLPRRAADPGGQGPRRDGARRSSAARATAATTSWSPTSSSGPRPTASASARAVARARARSPRTRCASPTSAPSSTACSSSGSSTPSARRCPTSTSTSTTRRRGEVITLRHREVRRRAGRADRDLRPAQGQGRDQGRRPRARPRLRDLATASPRRCRPT